MVETDTFVEIAGAAAFASTKGSSAIARNAQEAAFASTEKNGICAKIAGAVVFAIMERIKENVWSA